MTGFTFNTQAALKRARECPVRPTLPTLPTDARAEGEKVGTVGKVGTVRASVPEISPEELARDLYVERATIRGYEGGQDRAEAEHATKVEADKAAGETQTAFATLHQAQLASVSSSCCKVQVEQKRTERHFAAQAFRVW